MGEIRERIEKEVKLRGFTVNERLGLQNFIRWLI